MKKLGKTIIRNALQVAERSVESQPERKLNLFNSGIVINLKQAQERIIEIIRNKTETQRNRKRNGNEN